MSPTDYYRDLRLRHARLMMLNTTTPIVENRRRRRLQHAFAFHPALSAAVRRLAARRSA
jgi:hypothetical protein